MRKNSLDLIAVQASTSNNPNSHSCNNSHSYPLSMDNGASFMHKEVDPTSQASNIIYILLGLLENFLFAQAFPEGTWDFPNSLGANKFEGSNCGNTPQNCQDVYMSPSGGNLGNMCSSQASSGICPNFLSNTIDFQSHSQHQYPQHQYPQQQQQKQQYLQQLQNKRQTFHPYLNNFDPHYNNSHQSLPLNVNNFTQSTHSMQNNISNSNNHPNHRLEPTQEHVPFSSLNFNSNSFAENPANLIHNFQTNMLNNAGPINVSSSTHTNMRSNPLQFQQLLINISGNGSPSVGSPCVSSPSVGSPSVGSPSIGSPSIGSPVASSFSALSLEPKHIPSHTEATENTTSFQNISNNNNNGFGNIHNNNNNNIQNNNNANEGRNNILHSSNSMYSHVEFKSEDMNELLEIGRRRGSPGGSNSPSLNQNYESTSSLFMQTNSSAYDNGAEMLNVANIGTSEDSTSLGHGKQKWGMENFQAGSIQKARSFSSPALMEEASSSSSTPSSPEQSQSMVAKEKAKLEANKSNRTKSLTDKDRATNKKKSLGPRQKKNQPWTLLTGRFRVDGKN